MTHLAPHPAAVSRTDRRSPRGAALLLVLIAVGVAVITGLSFLESQSVSAGVSRNALDHGRARWIAESGIDLAAGYIRNNTDWRTAKSHGAWFTSYSYGGGTVSVDVEDGVDTDGDGTPEDDGSLSDNPTDPATITATALFNGCSYVARAIVNTSATQSTSVLLIVADDANPSAHELTRKLMIEAQGWSVVLLGRSATTATFQQAAASASAIYVSGTAAPSSTMLTNLRAIGLGVVVEDAALHDDLKLSNSAGAAFSDDNLNIVSTSHYITSTLGNGNQDIAASPQPLASPAGTLASGAIALGKRVGGGSPNCFYVIDVGSTLSGGAAAEGRRVFLPWSGASFNPASLTAAGQTLWKRSLEWAAGLDQTGPVTADRIGVTDSVTVLGGARIVSYSPVMGQYGGSNSGNAAVVSTNATSGKRISLAAGTTIRGNAYVGPAADPNAMISLGWGATITGSRAALQSPVAIAASSPPASMPASTGDLLYGWGTFSLSGDLHCNHFRVAGSSIVQVTGDCRLLVDGDFRVTEGGQLRILNNATLTVFASKGVVVDGSGYANINTADSSKLLIHAQNTGATVEVRHSGRLYATVAAPTRQLLVDGGAVFGGTFLGKKLTVDGSGVVAMDATANTPLAAGGGSVTYTYTVRRRQ